MCSPYQRYSPEYLQALEQDIQKYVTRTLLTNLIISFVHPMERCNAKFICDKAFSLIELINPPQTCTFRTLTFGSNAYNLLNHNNHINSQCNYSTYLR